MKKRTASVALALALAFPGLSLVDDGDASGAQYGDGPSIGVDASLSDGDGAGATGKMGAPVPLGSMVAHQLTGAESESDG